MLAQQTGHRPSEGYTLNRIGRIYYDQQKYDQALTFFQQALVIHQDIEDYKEILTSLINIAFVYREQEQYPQALEYYQQALSIARKIPNRLQEGIILFYIGKAYYDQGEYESAIHSPATRENCRDARKPKSSRKCSDCW
ncbi:DUF2225 domain-containing protein [Capilliphycus salinus ALCB114379]|uniref:DUF2225 domain-containing protein n=1 Tax=Capilliphycus salinus TaxID=2768948 RepID=UPI0039A415A2